MKKFITFIITAFIISVAASFTAKAQFTGGDTTKESPVEIIAIWSGFNKTFSVGDKGYFYTHILETPIKTDTGTIDSSILSLSLGMTKDEVAQTLNAYKNLLNSMKEGEWREITDTKSGITYNVIKQTKNMLVFSGAPTEQGKTVVHNNGMLTNKDIDRMLQELR